MPRQALKKSRLIRTIGNIVVMDILLLAMIVFSLIHLRSESDIIYVFLFFGVSFIVLNASAYPLFVLQGSSIVFGEFAVMGKGQILSQNINGK